MVEKVNCKNHQFVPSIAVCIDCKSPLCGQCSRFGDDGVRCERCAATHETAQLVAARSEKLKKPERININEALPNEDAPAPYKKKQGPKWIGKLVLAILSIAIAIPLYFYAYPAYVEIDSPTKEREQSVTALMQCLLVFRQIGELMQSGQEPDMSLQCASPSGPNIVRRNDTTIRVSHPNPQLYGVREISVTNLNPEPVIVQQ